LSVQIIVVDPRVSTDSRRRTSARWDAIRRAPIANDKVVVGSSPSGTSATVIPMGAAMKALTPSLGLPGAVVVIGIVVLVLAVGALLYAKETFGRSLAFDEQ
jgi:protein-S-isoprenylcysteine O-methyltransferase Ste14